MSDKDDSSKVLKPLDNDLSLQKSLKVTPDNHDSLRRKHSIKDKSPVMTSNNIFKDFTADLAMTSSIASVTSSLASPGDSGVQLLDSESDVASIMSMSYDFTLSESIEDKTLSSESKLDHELESPDKENRCSVILNPNIQILESSNKVCEPEIDNEKVDLMKPEFSGTENDSEKFVDENIDTTISDKLETILYRDEPNTLQSKKQLIIRDKSSTSSDFLSPLSINVMTSSDIANQNTTPPFYDPDHSAATNTCDLDQCPKVIKSNNKKGGDLDKQSNESSHCNENTYNHKLGGIYFSENSSRSDFNIKNTETMNKNKSKSDGNIQDKDAGQYFSKNTDCISNNVDSKNILTTQNTETVGAPIQNGIIVNPTDDQIVYRRQRKKKSRNHDAPKKRVSFHEDILNSTKIDDIHIDRGFITRQPDISMSFFGENSIRKRSVVKGRYSWAAEGDSPYYQKSIPEREVKSDIYVNNFYGSNSSSSSMSLESCSSSTTGSDESLEEQKTSSISDGLENIKKVPKSSCLKKPKNGRKYIGTNIVEEVNPHSCKRNKLRKKSDSGILDSNIFGSLKNIYRSLSLSSSVPLAERGVPEGQEDFTTYSSNQDLRNSKRSSFASNETLTSKSHEEFNINGFDSERETVTTGQMYKKPNLRLSRSEGFYPSYINDGVNQTENIILCDSNVYEHKGISYSYEYDKFQSSFAKQNQPKSSTVYQMLLKDLNFLKRSEQKDIVKNQDKPKVDQEGSRKASIDNNYNSNNSSPVKGQLDSKKKVTSGSSSIDWSSDNETISDFSEKQSSKHLQSPLRKKNMKPNHYSTPNNMKIPDNDVMTIEISSDNSSITDSGKIASNIKQPSSKSSLINRFLRNVTQKKLLDVKLQNSKKKILQDALFDLHIKGVKPNIELNKELDNEINREIKQGLLNKCDQNKYTKSMCEQMKTEIFRDENEILYKTYKVMSAYSADGESKPLLVVLTNTTLYITGIKQNQKYCNQFVLPYTEVNYIMIGPNGQTVYFTNADKDMQYFIVTGNSNTTSDMIGRIEMAMRKDANRPKLPAIKQLVMQDMLHLRHSICRQTAVAKDEDYYHYSVVNISDDYLSPSNTPLGPFKEGYLMYRKSLEECRWEIGYFILKGGVLYTLSTPTKRLPLQVTPLSGGACRGAHRTPPRPRPHTFELLAEQETLEFAASDEYEASEWLQAFVQAASGLYVYNDTPKLRTCSLLLTTDHLVMVRERFHSASVTSVNDVPNLQEVEANALSCAAIADVTAFRLPLAEQSWCVLEFACREVHETSGDWVLYFSTNTELEKFITTLEMLWSYNNAQGDSFPLSTIAENEPLNQHCSETYICLQQAWQRLESLYQLSNADQAARTMGASSIAGPLALGQWKRGPDLHVTCKTNNCLFDSHRRIYCRFNAGCPLKRSRRTLDLLANNFETNFNSHIMKMENSRIFREAIVQSNNRLSNLPKNYLYTSIILDQHQVTTRPPSPHCFASS